MEDKELIKQLYEKIDLLEKFILEISKVSEQKGWNLEDDEMKTIDMLSEKLNSVEGKINRVIKNKK